MSDIATIEEVLAQTISAVESGRAVHHGGESDTSPTDEPYHTVAFAVDRRGDDSALKVIGGIKKQGASFFKESSYMPSTVRPLRLDERPGGMIYAALAEFRTHITYGIAGCGKRLYWRQKPFIRLGITQTFELPGDISDQVVTPAEALSDFETCVVYSRLLLTDREPLPVSGKTTRQMVAAPPCALYICPSTSFAEDYGRKLAKYLGRDDLRLGGPYSVSAWMSYPGIVVDHACDLSKDRQRIVDDAHRFHVRKK